jgi:hypothetical protein
MSSPPVELDVASYVKDSLPAAMDDCRGSLYARIQESAW